MNIATLCFPVRDCRVLLGIKKNKIGQGKWNGFGGKIEEGDLSVSERAAKELEQESGLKAYPEDLNWMANIHFHTKQETGPGSIWRVYIFVVNKWKGTPIETNEMGSPTWFAFHEIPFTEMMPSDGMWLPSILLYGKRFNAKVIYPPKQTYVMDFQSSPNIFDE